MVIHFVDQATIPKGLAASRADYLPQATVYAVEEMEILPRKDDVIILHGRQQPIAFPKEYHTVWAMYFYVDQGIQKIFSVGYRHIV